MRFFVAGIDEAGRGPLAGPVTAACVVLKPGYSNPKIRDSKLVKEKDREELAKEIMLNSLAYSVVSVGPRRIEKINILQASLLAMKYAAARVQAQLEKAQLEKMQLDNTPQNASSNKIYFFCLVDGNKEISREFTSEAIIKGDQKFLSISAASILAKVERDKLMKTISDLKPQYQFFQHKGYPTILHRELIKEYGMSIYHRKTFCQPFLDFRA